MKFNELTLKPYKSGKRLGRGISSGRGKTAGRGTKGQNSRTGSGRNPGFEGGQNTFIQRMPKLRGFHSHKIAVENVYISQLDALGVTIDTTVLAEAGLISNPYVRVKLVTQGTVAKKHTVLLQAASENAVAAIQKAGGTFKAVPQLGRPSKKQDKQQAAPADKK